MPNIKSAKKRVRVSEVKTQRNKAIRSSVRTAVKKANTAIETNAADKEAVVRAAIKTLDQAGAKGLYHKNAVAHKKSQLSKKLAAAK